MDFDAWICSQRARMTGLCVLAGQYSARRSERTDTYSAALLVTRSTSGVIVQITRSVTGVLARVLYNGSEYDYEPCWTRGQGVGAHRRWPAQVSAESATITQGMARAALIAAAREEYERLVGLALDTDEERWPEVLEALTDGEAPSLEHELRAALVDVLAGRDDGVEFAEVREACECVACGKRYAPGASGPVVLFRSTAICAGCLRPSARRTWPVAPSIALADLAAAVEEGDSLIISREYELR
jgi:hypothetical protein